MASSAIRCDGALPGSTATKSAVPPSPQTSASADTQRPRQRRTPSTASPTSASSAKYACSGATSVPLPPTTNGAAAPPISPTATRSGPWNQPSTTAPTPTAISPANAASAPINP